MRGSHAHPPSMRLGRSHHLGWKKVLQKAHSLGGHTARLRLATLASFGAARPARAMAAAGAAGRRRCRAILFDLDDTLVPTSRIDAAAIARASALGAAQLGLGEGGSAQVASAFTALLGAEPFPPVGSPQPVLQWRTALWARALSPSGDDAELAREVHDTWSSERLAQFKLAPEVRAVVERVHTAGYKTGVVTNGHAEVQRAKIAACGLSELFGSRIVVSGEQPEWKPAASIFATSLALIGASADETIMVGDSLAADIQGGINAGLLATVWVHGNAGAWQKAPAGGPQPTFLIGSVLELERVLESL